MFKLMNLEIKRNKLNTYIVISFILCILVIGLPYFVSYASKTDNKVEFQNYKTIFIFTQIMSMFMFSVLSSVMYSRFIIEEYTGNRLVLLFSYPCSRRKILVGKILIIVLFTTFSMTICNILSISIFSITESISPIIKDTISAELILQNIKTLIILSLIVSGVGVIAMRIGFINKSVPLTIVVSFILPAFFANGVILSNGNFFFSMALVTIIAIIASAITIELMNKVNKMDVE